MLCIFHKSVSRACLWLLESLLSFLFYAGTLDIVDIVFLFLFFLLPAMLYLSLFYYVFYFDWAYLGFSSVYELASVALSDIVFRVF
jgi:hypothetical protein